MLHEFMNQNLFLYAMLAAGAVSLWCMFWTSHFYNRAIRDFMHMDKPKSKWTKSVLGQLEGRKSRLSNPEAFVQAKLIEGKTGGLYVYQMNRVYVYMIGVCLFCALAASYAAYQFGAEKILLYRNLIISGIVIAGIFLMRQILMISGKEQMLMERWLDYLENQFEYPQIPKVSEAEIPEAVPRPVLDAQEEERIAKVREGIRQTAATDSKFSHLLTPEEEDVMREVIREYLT